MRTYEGFLSAGYHLIFKWPKRPPSSPGPVGLTVVHAVCCGTWHTPKSPRGLPIGNNGQLSPATQIQCSAAARSFSRVSSRTLEPCSHLVGISYPGLGSSSQGDEEWSYVANPMGLREYAHISPHLETNELGGDLLQVNGKPKISHLSRLGSSSGTSTTAPREFEETE